MHLDIGSRLRVVEMVSKPLSLAHAGMRAHSDLHTWCGRTHLRLFELQQSIFLFPFRNVDAELAVVHKGFCFTPDIELIVEVV